MKTIRWGIIGCGKIARKFTADLKWAKGAQLTFAAARDREQARAFAQEFQAVAFGDYDELINHPEVDVIYIATPHALHYEHATLCLQHDKAVLCEKAFTINHAQAKELVHLARNRRVFLMEAFWTRFLPHYRQARQFIDEGKLGDIRYLYAEFGFRPTLPVSPRLYDPTLGGGSLLDIGVYPVFLALDVLGRPDEITAHMTGATTGVDEQCTVRFNYANGAIAQLFSTFSTNLASGADIAGTHGRLRFTHRFHGPTARLEYYPDIVDSLQSIETETSRGFGYEYEAQHVTDCLQQGLTESPIRTLDDTLLLMETLDRIRSAAGIRYPVDQ